MKKTIVIAIIAILGVGGATAGVIYGTNLLKTPTAPESVQPANEQQPKEAAVTQAEAVEVSEDASSVEVVVHDSETIAIVNLDEGFTSGDELQVYSEQIITLPDETYVFTSLTDAEAGIEDGRYGAYIIIPATFSTTIASINSTPQSCNMEYVIDPYSANQNDLIVDVYNFYYSVNNNISYMYLASIMSEFHDAQDEAEEVLANDILDKNAITSIKPEDILTTVTISASTLPQYEGEPLDISSYPEQINASITSINDEYLTSISSINEKIGNINSSLSSLKTEMGSTKSYLEQSGYLTNSIDEIPELTLDQQDYIIGDLNSSVDDQGQDQSQNPDVNTGSTTVEASQDDIVSLKNYITILKSNLLAAINNNRNAEINSLDAIQYELVSTGNNNYELKSGDTVIASFTATTTNSGTQYVLSQDQLNALCTNLNANSTNTTTNLKNAMLANQISNLELYTDYSSGSPVSYSLNGVLSNIDSSVAGVEQELGESDSLERAMSIIDDINSQIDSVNEQIANTKTGITNKIDECNGYITDLETTINDNQLSFDPSNISTKLTTLNKLVTNMFKDAVESNTSYATYASDLYKAESSILAELKQNISNAQTQYETAIADGLSNAITVKNQTSEENQALMQDFINKLQYTKLGSLENTAVYQFIVNPVYLKDASGN